jgi:uncharacterized membrane protein YedE/YeeE
VKLRVSALALGILAGFVFAWARLTDPETFHRMLSLDSPRVYLLMGAAVGVAFAGARILRGRRALLTGERIEWRGVRPTRSHVIGSALFGVGWALTDACPGPIAAQLGGGRVFALAVAAGIVAGVRVQPAIAGAVSRARRAEDHAPVVAAADVL